MLIETNEVRYFLMESKADFFFACLETKSAFYN